MREGMPLIFLWKVDLVKHTNGRLLYKSHSSFFEGIFNFSVTGGRKKAAVNYGQGDSSDSDFWSSVVLFQHSCPSSKARSWFVAYLKLCT